MANKLAEATTYRGVPMDKCHRMLQRSLQASKVKFLMEQLEKAGCKIGDNFIKPVNCGDRRAGGFSRGRGITVCCNYLHYQDEFTQAVTHELIHAYDECRVKNMNWTNCAHHACSEIRAGHLSGDCHLMRELLRGFWKIKGHEQECVKRRVMKSMRANPFCSEAASKDAVEAVWDACYNDTKPYDKAP